jgi:serine/threonine-protein kinase
MSIDRARWPALSPWLDELLDLDAAARAQRLAALRAEDAALADELGAWLDHLASIDASPFLHGVALPPPPGLAGQAVGAYVLERELGRGGMGTVWLARRTDGRYEGQVAIKFLQTGLFGAGDGGRFAREGRILARLAHPHIARLLDAGHLPALGPGPAQPYLVLEYVAGEPIDAWCAQRALPLAARLRLFADVLAAVSHAHNRLILHRDLKPSNILVTAAGEVKLLDFGIAKLLDDGGDELTQQAGAAFTPQYAAPEQLQGGEVTTATDVYALGVLLYKLLSGRHPTGEGDAATLERLRAVVETEPPPVSAALLAAGGADAPRRARALRGDLDTLVAKALKKDPAQRYANAAELADDLQRHLAHLPILARPDTWRYRGARFLRRHRVAVGAGTAAVLALAGTAGLALQQARQAQQQQAQAEGLIEFMLGDLPAKLKPVGRLDALDAVGQRALAYYAAQSPGRLDAESLGRRARALHLAGEIAEQTGQLEEAARRFGEAAASTSELLARHPQDPAHVFNHSQSAYWVGFIARRRGLTAQAETAFGEYQALAQQLTLLEPAKTDWRIEAAYAGQNLGVLRLETGRPAEALQAFGQTLQAWTPVVAQQPAMAMELANTLGWLSKAHEASNDYDAAIAALQGKFDALARVPDAARDRDVQYQRGVAHYDVARLQLAQGQAEPAATSLRQALALFEGLVKLDGRNLDWLAQLGSVRASLAELMPGSAEGEAQRRALDPLVARLLATPERKVRWWLILQGRLLALRAQSGEAGADAALRTWLDEVAAHEAGGRVLDAEQARTAAAAGLALGDLQQRAGQPALAAASWRAAAARLPPGPLRRQPPTLLLLGRLALRLQAPQEARDWAEMLVSNHYRHPDVADLRQALAQEAVAGR